MSGSGQNTSGQATSIEMTSSGSGSSDPLFGPNALPRVFLVTEYISRMYYIDLPSKPRLIATTKPHPFEFPVGPEGTTKVKELRVLGNHSLAICWDEVSTDLRRHLSSWEVKWTSVEAFRIPYVEDASPGPAIIWIGVIPDSITFERGGAVAANCRPVVDAYGITDYHVEIRESLVEMEGASKFLKTLPLESNSDLRSPYTTTLGTPIATQTNGDAEKQTWKEGSGGFFLSAGGEDKNIYLVTARHVVVSADDGNEEYIRTDHNQPRKDVIALGPMAFETKLADIKNRITINEETIDIVNTQIELLDIGSAGNPKADGSRTAKENRKNVAKDMIDQLGSMRDEIQTRWKAPADRVFGHLVWAPPIELSTEPNKYTLDIAVIQVDPDALDAENYLGNTINLYTNYSRDAFLRTVNLDCKKRDSKEPKPENSFSFQYPKAGLLKLRGEVPESDLRRLPMFDEAGDPCLVVFKNGAKTGITVGKANNVASYTRTYHNGLHQESREWAIISIDKDRGPFSKEGDSGSCVADIYGRVAGILTGGTKGTPTAGSDVSYVTPISFIMEALRNTELFRQAHLDPVLA